MQSSPDAAALDSDFFHPVDEALEMLEQSLDSGLMKHGVATPTQNFGPYPEFPEDTEDLDFSDLGF